MRSRLRRDRELRREDIQNSEEGRQIIGRDGNHRLTVLGIQTVLWIGVVAWIGMLRGIPWAFIITLY